MAQLCPAAAYGVLVMWGFVVWLRASRVEQAPEPERVHQ